MNFVSKFQKRQFVTRFAKICIRKRSETLHLSGITECGTKFTFGKYTGHVMGDVRSTFKACV